MDSSDVDVAKLFPMYNRTLHISICAILAFFGIINLIGYSQLKHLKISFSADQCKANICSVTQDLDFSDRTTVYVHYPFFQTSYFIYSKGLAYNQIFKKYSYLTDNYQCYPIKTYREHNSVLGDLGINLDLSNSKNQRLKDLLVQNGENGLISPCGLKAALSLRIGNLSIQYPNDSPLPSDLLDTDHLVDQKYIDAAQNSTGDYLDVKSGRFLSWYLPQIPELGTRMVTAILPKGLKGTFKVNFDQSDVFYDKTKFPTINFIEQPQGIARQFSNLVFGIIMLCLGVAVLALLTVYLVVEKRRSS